ncbi:MAG: DUF6033 family protein [Eubacterium sp.]|nr:DUF6033 family protein [Eubacterium sp.]
MGMTPQIAGNMSAASTYGTQKTDNKAKLKNSKVYGKTVGQPKLSEKAQKYYEELKKKYQDMEFILVSENKKDDVQANAGRYAAMSGKETVVLIDEEKIERMAEDEAYRSKYEGIIQNASSQLSQMSKKLADSGASVKTVGMQVNDNGTATLFAALQKERIDKKQHESDDIVTITANSLEELVQKVSDYMFMAKSDTVQTEAEKMVGQSFDLRG